MVTQISLEEEVEHMIEDLYGYKYVGKLCIEPLEGGYRIVFGLNCPEKPISFSIQGNREQFLKQLREELRNSRFHYTKYYFGDKLR